MGLRGAGAAKPKKSPKPAKRQSSAAKPLPWEAEGLSRVERVGCIPRKTCPITQGKLAGTKFIVRTFSANIPRVRPMAEDA